MDLDERRWFAISGKISIILRGNKHNLRGRTGFDRDIEAKSSMPRSIFLVNPMGKRIIADYYADSAYALAA